MQFDCVVKAEREIEIGRWTCLGLIIRFVLDVVGRNLEKALTERAVFLEVLEAHFSRHCRNNWDVF